MSKKQIIFLVVALVILAIVVFVSKNSSKTGDMKQDASKTGQMKNAEMLKHETNLEITGEMVSYFPNANGYYVKPKGNAAYPGIVVIHENRGLRPETKMAAEQLAKEGYMVLAVDLFGATAEDQTGAQALTAKFDQKKGVENMRAAVAYLRAKGAGEIASLGWCFGGKQSLMLAISGEKLDATVVYYGGGMPTTLKELSPIGWPVLGIFGGADQNIPLTMVQTFEKSLNDLNIENQIYIYPGVGHAFANPSGMNYAPNETKDAWAKTLAFLKDTIGR